MALFDNLFPYTNLHDINLDWMISIIKSIDPAVIQALQQLTPDIIEQASQKVSEAQAAAIAAQSSASEAKTAKENAANSESKALRYSSQAAASSTVAIEAKNEIKNSLATTYGTITDVATDYITPSINITSRTGNTAFISLSGTMSGNKSTDAYTRIGAIPYNVSTQIYIPATIDNTAVTAAILGNFLYITTSDITAGFLRVNGGFAIG